MFHTDLDEKIWLSDKGIRVAFSQGLISGISPARIQPATVDVKSSDDKLLGGFQMRMIHHSRVTLKKGLQAFGDLRSSVRRKGLNAFYWPEDQGLFIANPSAQQYLIRKGDAFAQLHIGGSGDSVASEFKHGNVLTTNEELEKMIREGHISIGGKTPILENGFLVFHASDRAYVLNVNPIGEVRMIEKSDFHDKTKYTKTRLNGESIRFNSPVNIVLAERISLSQNVSLQLFYHDPETGEVQLNGVVDPGYQGNLTSQPTRHQPRKITGETPIVWARAIYFPDGVETPYDKKSQAQYQKARY